MASSSPEGASRFEQPIMLAGGLGNDGLKGDAGNDIFGFAETGPENSDTILDYSFAEGDALDLSALLDTHFGSGAPGSNDVSNFVRVQDSGDDATVQVDVDGTGGAATWTDVATLTNYGNVGNQVLVLPKGLTYTPPAIAGNYIDELVGAKLNKIRLLPSGLCTDEQFLRRVTIDITGLLPTEEQYAAFMADADLALGHVHRA